MGNQFPSHTQATAVVITIGTAAGRIPDGGDFEVVVRTGHYMEVAGDSVAEKGTVAQEVKVHIRHGGGIFGGVGDVDFGPERQRGFGGVQDLESANLGIEPADRRLIRTPRNCCESK